MTPQQAQTLPGAPHRSIRGGFRTRTDGPQAPVRRPR